MEDFFALLGEERRPVLDAEALKEKYHRLTAEQHPDVAAGDGGGAFAEINRAYKALSDPAARLRHLLELETGAPPARTQAVPAEIEAFFGPVGLARQRAQAFLKKHAAASSPLARALLSTEQYQVQEELEEQLGELDAARKRVLAAVDAIDALWAGERARAMQLLPEFWQSLGYLDKWLGALREDLFRFAGL